MKFFKKEKRHLSKYKKAKPNVRLSVTKKKILEQQEMCAYGAMVRRDQRTKRREGRVEHLGSNLIKALEWGYMRKRLRGKELKEQKEIAEFWAVKLGRVKG